ncbi:hypothetical protein NKJ59_11975 [Mesorhizobium australicum]|uniref:hypothetical protein n=1 Tax=Mesorhizobium australicum TaxID=536018 RepID=UPI00333709AE
MSGAQFPTASTASFHGSAVVDLGRRSGLRSRSTQRDGSQREDQPPQFCTFSWDLHTMAGDQKVAGGSFMLPPGASNVQVYQGSGFDSALSNPIVICRGNK